MSDFVKWTSQCQWNDKISKNILRCTNYSIMYFLVKVLLHCQHQTRIVCPCARMRRIIYSQFLTTRKSIFINYVESSIYKNIFKFSAAWTFKNCSTCLFLQIEFMLRVYILLCCGRTIGFFLTRKSVSLVSPPFFFSDTKSSRHHKRKRSRRTLSTTPSCQTWKLCYLLWSRSGSQ